MYEKVETDKEIVTRAVNGSVYHPVATLADKYGGRIQVCIDDHCFILMLKRENVYVIMSHWPQDVVDVVKDLDDISLLEKRGTG